MLPDLLLVFADDYKILNLFRYITFRTGGAIITALILCLMFGERFIIWLKKHQAEGQPIRSDGPETHILTKAGTPTMGGLLILGSFILATLLWVPLSNQYLWPVLLIATSFGVIGATDDWLKLKRRSSDGMSGRQKLFFQVIAALVASLIFIQLSPENLRYGVAVPFLKDTLVYLGLIYVPVSYTHLTLPTICSV